MDIESIVNELTEKRVKDKILKFLDGEVDQNGRFSDSDMNYAFNEKIRECLDNILKAHELDMTKMVFDAFKNKLKNCDKHMKITVYFE